MEGPSPVVDPSSVALTPTGQPGFPVTLPDIPMVEAKRSRPLKVAEKRRMIERLEGVRVHLK